jgi:hypothetical protein
VSPSPTDVATLAISCDFAGVCLLGSLIQSNRCFVYGHGRSVGQHIEQSSGIQLDLVLLLAVLFLVHLYTLSIRLQDIGRHSRIRLTAIQLYIASLVFTSVMRLIKLSNSACPFARSRACIGNSLKGLVLRKPAPGST